MLIPRRGFTFTYRYLNELVVLKRESKMMPLYKILSIHAPVKEQEMVSRWEKLKFIFDFLFPPKTMSGRGQGPR